ncbi:hypothetical protein L1765_08940 [Microaerobacter geothermalis]|uniref:hypothetical protein n=1 Tax=Microaerobacter geothermalis TaxID=674972 RepID=UPI001F22615D|nr:hypothetical protein [Microaerobacter geothermalis]MCF6094086.1 hypothetical protein [Microaerobacter geothermalis]
METKCNCSLRGDEVDQLDLTIQENEKTAFVIDEKNAEQRNRKNGRQKRRDLCRLS